MRYRFVVPWCGGSLSELFEQFSPRHSPSMKRKVKRFWSKESLLLAFLEMDFLPQFWSLQMPASCKSSNIHSRSQTNCFFSLHSPLFTKPHWILFQISTHSVSHMATHTGVNGVYNWILSKYVHIIFTRATDKLDSRNSTNENTDWNGWKQRESTAIRPTRRDNEKHPFLVSTTEAWKIWNS